MAWSYKTCGVGYAGDNEDSRRIDGQPAYVQWVRRQLPPDGMNLAQFAAHNAAVDRGDKPESARLFMVSVEIMEARAMSVQEVAMKLGITAKRVRQLLDDAEFVVQENLIKRPKENNQ
jgi:hypothetical protein